MKEPKELFLASRRAWRGFRDGGLEWIHVAIGLTILGSSYYLGMTRGQDDRVRFAYWFFAVYLCLILLGFAYFVHTSARKARYAEAMTCIHGAIHTMRDASWWLDQSIERTLALDEMRFRLAVAFALDSTAKAFSIVTGTNNRACIKVLGAAKDTSAHVKTFCRDSLSAIQCRHSDENEGELRIDENTDFHLILTHNERYFLCNDLTKAGDFYRNSHAPGGKGCPKNYKATLVLPIRYVLTEKDHQIAPGAPGISYLGFLAIDSKARGIYSERYDVEMGAVVADALFSLLYKWEMLKRVYANST